MTCHIITLTTVITVLLMVTACLSTYIDDTDSAVQVMTKAKRAIKTEDVFVPVIGIDFGMAFSSVGLYQENNTTVILSNEQGNRLTPSYVAFTHNGQIIVGDAAKQQQTSNPENTIFDFKRFMGRTWNDPKVQNNIKNYQFKFVNVTDKPFIEINGGSKTLSPLEITSIYLGYLKNIAESHIGANITHAVITVPASFDDSYRSAIKDAANFAGLTDIRLLNKPVTAIVAYGLDKVRDDKPEMNILTFDLGERSFEVALVNVDNGIFEILSSHHDYTIGGESFDKNVVEFLIKRILKETGSDVRAKEHILGKLRHVAVNARQKLSSEYSTEIHIESLFSGYDLRLTLARQKFEELNKDLIQTALRPIQRILDEVELKHSDIDNVVLIGESGTLPKIQNLIRNFFDNRDGIIINGVNDPVSDTVPPSEAAAYGAAISADRVYNRQEDEILLCGGDSTVLSLGIETLGGVMTTVIEKNTWVRENSLIFSTANHNQLSMDISIYEGERPMTKDNYPLGMIHLEGIPPAPRGVPEIKVTFEVFLDDRVKVTAEVLNTEIKKEKLIDISERTFPEDYNDMITEAETYADDDDKQRDRIDTRHDLEIYAISVYNSVNHNHKRVGREPFEHEKKIINKALQKTFDWLETSTEDLVGQSFKRYKTTSIDDFIYQLNELKEVTEPIITKPYEVTDNSNRDEL